MSLYGTYCRLSKSLYQDLKIDAQNKIWKVNHCAKSSYFSDQSQPFACQDWVFQAVTLAQSCLQCLTLIEIHTHKIVKVSSRLINVKNVPEYSYYLNCDPSCLRFSANSSSVPLCKILNFPPKCISVFLLTSIHFFEQGITPSDRTTLHIHCTIIPRPSEAPPAVARPSKIAGKDGKFKILQSGVPMMGNTDTKIIGAICK